MDIEFPLTSAFEPNEIFAAALNGSEVATITLDPATAGFAALAALGRMQLFTFPR